MNTAAALGIGLAGGLLGGLLGVGGGIIMVPLLMSWLGKEIHDAKAVSLAIICLVSVSGTIQHHRMGMIDWRVVAYAGVVAMIASPVGAKLSANVPKEVLLRWFALMLIVTGFRYLFQTMPDNLKPERWRAAVQREAPVAPPR